jgi:putative transposase
MQFHEGGIYHIYNRGNNKQRIFFTDANYLYFLDKVGKHIYPNCDILAWCLMPNHFHFLIQANEKTCQLSKTNPGVVNKLSNDIGLMLSSYSKAINKQETRIGNLFQQRTKSKLVHDSQNNYGLTAFHYIHQNPMKAQLVSRMEDWKFSSFTEYMGLRDMPLCNTALANALFNLKPETFVSDSYAALNEDSIKKIW